VVGTLRMGEGRGRRDATLIDDGTSFYNHPVGASPKDPPHAPEPATSLSGQAALARENARLRKIVEGERRRADLAEERLAEVERLRQIGLDLACSLDLTGIVERVVQVTRRHAVSDIALCAVVDPATFHVEALAASGASAPPPWTPGSPAGHALIGWILRHARPFHSEDCRIDPRLAPGAEPAGHADGVIACVGAPLLQGTRPIGALWIGNRTRRPFTDRDEAFLAEVANHAVAAIVNARTHAELQRRLDELRDAQQRLVTTERLRALGEMAAGVAHDFNNLLAVILGRAQLLMLRTEDPQVRRGLAQIESAATEAAQTVRRIQEFTRTRQSRTSAPLDVGQVLRDAIGLTRSRWKDEAQIRGVTFAISTDIAETPPVAGDVEELRELFANLLLNAFDAMPEGGAVSVSLRAVADGVVAEVTDTGPGIDPEIRHRIFEPFFTTRGPRRTGLGLSVVYGIVQRHHGAIDVHSAVSRGTTFVVSLPIGTGPSRPNPHAPATE
jgi:signal transduction histidine kinase